MEGLIFGILRYEEDIKQFSSGSTNSNTLFGEFCMHSIKTWKSWPNSVYFKFQSMSTFAIHCNRAYSHDVTAAMLVSQTSPVGIELFSYVNAFFCSNKFA